MLVLLVIELLSVISVCVVVLVLIRIFVNSRCVLVFWLFVVFSCNVWFWVCLLVMI